MGIRNSKYSITHALLQEIISNYCSWNDSYIVLKKMLSNTLFLLFSVKRYNLTKQEEITLKPINYFGQFILHYYIITNDTPFNHYICMYTI